MALEFINNIIDYIEDKLLDLIPPEEYMLTGDLVADDQTNNSLDNKCDIEECKENPDSIEDHQKSVDVIYWNNLPGDVQKELLNSGYHKQKGNEL